jgi:hypothetical protein
VFHEVTQHTKGFRREVNSSLSMPKELIFGIEPE